MNEWRTRGDLRASILKIWEAGKVILAVFVFSIDAHYSLKFISEKLFHRHFLDIFPKTLGQLIFLAHVKYYFQLL